MDQADQDAVRILGALRTLILGSHSGASYELTMASLTLARAQYHLIRPDRARYPKTRRGTKRHPVELSYGNRPNPQ